MMVMQIIRIKYDVKADGDAVEDDAGNDNDDNAEGCPQNAFSEKVGLLAQQGGGGLTEAQVFVKIFQNQICLVTV